MKNNFKILIGTLSVLFFATSCEQEFLDQTPTGNTITSVQLGEGIELNPKLGEATLTGLYATMFTTGTGGIGGAYDFGHKAHDIWGDMLSGDMALTLSTFGWYRSDITEFQAPTDFTRNNNYMVWRYHFRIINLANLVIESLGGTDSVPESQDAKNSMGQALAMRAYGYFYLSQYMINDVEASWQSATLPIYTTPGFEGAERSTTKEVYEFMENDLTKAIEYLDGYSRPTKTQINKPIAQTLLAYVLGSRRDRWSDVVSLTTSALAGSSASPMTTDDSINGILGGFNDVNSQSWMWGVDLNADIGLSLTSWWGKMDYFSYSYAAYGDNKGMDSGLYESMKSDDVRRGQFLNRPSSRNHLQPIYKFYDSDRVPAGSSQIVKADYIYMRYEEPMLLRIEALAQSGQEGQAKSSLKDFVATRVSDASYIDALSGVALLNEIQLQTRLEFWGEGKSYLAMKRFKSTYTRGDNHVSFPGTSYSYNDEKLTFEIPLQEIQNNLNINDQN